MDSEKPFFSRDEAEDNELIYERGNDSNKSRLEVKVNNKLYYNQLKFIKL